MGQNPHPAAGGGPRKTGHPALQEGWRARPVPGAVPDSGVLNIDVVEQSAPRSVHDDAQRAQYSGKSKDHTHKNMVDCTENQYVVYLSPTFLGSVHDKKIADETASVYPEGTRIRQDSGFQGYEPEGTLIEMPFKKPKNGELTVLQKWYNTYVGQRRVVVEHAIRGIKRFRIIQHACRLKGYWVRDRITNICTAIHNLRVKSPLRNYESKFKFELGASHARAHLQSFL